MYKIESTYEIPSSASGEPAFTLARFVELVCATDKRFARNMTGVLAAVRISANPLSIESADMALLQAACNEPETDNGGYALQPARLLAPWLVVIRDAKESK